MSARSSTLSYWLPHAPVTFALSELSSAVAATPATTLAEVANAIVDEGRNRPENDYRKPKGNGMFRKLIAVVLLVAALAAGIGAIPGVVENLAHACNPNDPNCGG